MQVRFVHHPRRRRQPFPWFDVVPLANIVDAVCLRPVPEKENVFFVSPWHQ